MTPRLDAFTAVLLAGFLIPALRAGPATAPAVKTANQELAHDDGKSAGRKSIAGSGHAVKFQTPADGCHITSVKVFGSRYGHAQPPDEDFHVILCDADGNEIRDFPFPYKTFLRGEGKWVTLKLEPTEVPAEFIICLSFDPAATKGVYVHHDAALDGDSRTGLPGAINDAFDKGDWMIRAVVTAP